MSARAGRDTVANLLAGRGDLRKSRLSVRRNLAEIAITRLMMIDLPPETKPGPEEKLIIGIVAQAVRDIGKPGACSLRDWKRQHTPLDGYLELMGANPECARDVLRTLHLWRSEDIRPPPRRPPVRVEMEIGA